MNNTDVIISIQKKLSELAQQISDHTKAINGLKIDRQMMVKIEKPIRSGVATKVAYNSKGIITAAMVLDNNDLPDIPISKIIGLQSSLDEKANNTQIERLMIQLKNVYKKGAIAQSGSKINIDEHGLVVSVTDLCAADIPTLPISKIEGLTNELAFIKASLMTDIHIPEEINVKPSTGCKITYDKHGHVTGSAKLDITDIPNEIIMRLNTFESKLVGFVTIAQLTNVKKQLGTKIESNEAITPGTYTKVTVDKKGLITYGEEITTSDLPEITVNDITGLRNELNEKASRADITSINTAIGTIVSKLDRLGDLNALSRSVSEKASKESVLELAASVSELRKIIGDMSSAGIMDAILAQIKTMNDDIATLANKVANIERKN